MKKFFSLVLALVMALSLTTVAWGVDYVSSGVNCETNTEVSATHTGNVNFAGADPAREDVALRVTGNAVIEDAVLNAADRGIDGDGAFTSITIDNVTVVNSARAIHIQSSTAAELYVSNSVFAGKISYCLNGGTATFTNCTFKANSALVAAKGNLVEPWSETVFINCVFEDGFEVSLDDWKNPSNPDKDLAKTVELNNCTYDGEPITAANIDDLITNTDSHGLVFDASIVPAAFTGVAYNVYDANGNLVVANTTYTENDGTPVNQLGFGEVDYFTIADMAGKFVEVSKAEKADADYYLTLVGQSDARIYLKEVAETDYVVAKKFTNIGTACDQLNVNKKYDYYVYVDPTDDEDYYFVACKNADATDAVMVGGELIQVKLVAQELNAHVWQIEAINADHEVTDISCKLCGVDAKVYESKLAAPKGAWKDPVYGWIALVAPTASTPSTDKVTSADTFDAGIAMYVGMSVMAAAGSAVVIGKKKD